MGRLPLCLAAIPSTRYTWNLSHADEKPRESLLQYSKRLKSRDREQLAKLDPGEAQARAQQVFDPSVWTILDVGQRKSTIMTDFAIEDLRQVNDYRNG